MHIILLDSHVGWHRHPFVTTIIMLWVHAVYREVESPKNKSINWRTTHGPICLTHTEPQAARERSHTVNIQQDAAKANEWWILFSRFM